MLRALMEDELMDVEGGAAVEEGAVHEGGGGKVELEGVCYPAFIGSGGRSGGWGVGHCRDERGERREDGREWKLKVVSW